jgi:hypothetical protein
MMKKLYYLIISCLLISSQGYSQRFFSDVFNSERSIFKRKKAYEPHSSIAFGIGTSNYYGDLAPVSRPVKSTTQNINWNLSVDLTRHLSPHTSVRFGLTWVRLSGDDSNFEGDVKYPNLFFRNTHFRNDIQELSAVGIYSFVAEQRAYTLRPKLIPYVFGGFSILHHNPVAQAPKGTLGVEDGEWVSLQPLGTEGQTLPTSTVAPYNLIVTNALAGLGLRVSLNKQWDIAYELGLRYLFTDYIDDVGGVYGDKAAMAANDPLSAVFGHRELELVAVRTGVNREAAIRQWYADQGSPQGAAVPVSAFPIAPGTAAGGNRNFSATLNDMYLLNTFKLVYHITPQIKCPKPR